MSDERRKSTLVIYGDQRRDKNHRRYLVKGLYNAELLTSMRYLRLVSIPITVLTFFLGVGIVLFEREVLKRSDEQLAQQNNQVTIVASPAARNPVTECSLSNPVSVTYELSTTNYKNEPYALFLLKNNTSTNIYYRGIGHVPMDGVIVKQNDQILKSRPTVVSDVPESDFREIKIKPGQCQLINSVAPENEEPFRVEFTFKIGRDRKLTTVEVNVDKPFILGKH